MNPPCCTIAELAITNQVSAELIKYLAAQPRTPELVEFVRRLMRINPAFDKLMDLFTVS